MPAGIDIYVPHRRAARAVGAVRRTLEDEAWRRLYREGLRPADVSERQLILSAAVKEVLKPEDPSGVAGWLRPSVEALLRSGTDPSILFDDESGRVRDLAKVAGRYLELVAAREMVDPAQALWRAAELGLERRQALIYGYFRPRADELTLIDALAGDNSVLLLPAGEEPLFRANREAIRHLKDRGWEIGPTDPTARAYGQRVAAAFASGGKTEDSAYRYSNIEEEARGVLARVKKLLLDGVSPGEIVISARDERLYGPVIEAIGWEYGVPINLLYKIPASETRFGSWLKLLLETVTDGFEFEPVTRMMKHSLGPGLPDEVWSRSRRAHTKGIEGWTELGIDPGPLDWPRMAARKEFAELLFAALDRYRIRAKSAIWSRELTAYNTFRASWDALDSPDEPVSIEEFAGGVRDLIESLSVDYQPGGYGIEMHAPQNLFGSSYSHIFIVGMAEGIMPAPVTEDQVLDFHERKRLAAKGMRLDSAADMARREELAFYLTLCTAAERITFSYPMMNGREQLIESPYLKRLGIAVEPGPRIGPASAEEARPSSLRSSETRFDDDVRDTARHALEVEWRRESSEPRDEYDGMTGRPLNADEREWSASQLTAIGQCPFKWFAQKVLCINEPEEMEAELTPALRGQLYHKTLELALKNAGSDPTQVALDRLEAAFMRAEEEIGIPELPAWYAQRREHIQLLRRAIESPDFIVPGARVIETEKNFNWMWHGLKVRGYIDRIDETPDGIVMIDYKTGKSVPPGVKNDQGKAEIDIQIPIYVSAAGGQLYPDDDVSGVYFSLTNAEILKTKGAHDEAELEKFAGEVRRRLVDGRYPVDPDNGWKACGYCDYEAVCRYGARLSRKACE